MISQLLKIKKSNLESGESSIVNSLTETFEEEATLVRNVNEILSAQNFTGGLSLASRADIPSKLLLINDYNTLDSSIIKQMDSNHADLGQFNKTVMLQILECTFDYHRPTQNFSADANNSINAARNLITSFERATRDGKLTKLLNAKGLLLDPTITQAKTIDIISRIVNTTANSSKGGDTIPSNTLQSIDTHLQSLKNRVATSVKSTLFDGFQMNGAKFKYLQFQIDIT